MDIETVVNGLGWLKVDKYLFSKVEENIGVFEKLIDFNDTPINSIPAIRSVARNKLLDENSMIKIVEGIHISIESVDPEDVRIWLCEKVDNVFCKMYLSEIKEFIDLGNDDECTYDFMRKTLGNLGGQTAKHFITNGLEFFYNE